MMFFSELEVGNWINVKMVDSKNHYAKVIEKNMEEQKVSVCFLDTKEAIWLCEIDFKESLRGISISEEILSKCGFTPDSVDNSFVKYKGLEKDCIVKDLGNQGWGLKVNYPLLNTDNSYFTNLYELHKLQNLYNELTEEKLILNL